MADQPKSKTIAKNTLVMYIRMFITTLISLYSSRIILRALGAEDFGIYNLVGGMVALFAFLNSAMTASTQRFINYELGSNDSKSLCEVFQTSFLIHLLLAILISGLGILIGKYFIDYELKIPSNRIIAAQTVLYLSLITCALQIINLPFNAEIIAHGKFNIYAYLSIFESLSRLGIAFLIEYSKDRLIIYAFCLVLLQLVITLINITYCRLNFTEATIKIKFYKSKFIEMSKFASWSLLGTTANAFSTQGLNVLLGIFFNPIVNAARGIAVQVQNAIGMFGANVNVAMTPQITQSYAEKDFQFFFNLLYRGSKYIIFLMLFIAIPILIKTPYILELWLGDYPPYTVVFARWLIMVTLINNLSYPLMRASDASGYIKSYYSTVGGIQLLTLPIAYAVLKLHQNPTIAFIIYFCMQVVALFSSLMILKRTIKLSISSYFKFVVWRITVVLGIAYTFNLLVISHIPNTILGFGASIVISTFLTSITIYTLGLDVSERRKVTHDITMRLKGINNFSKFKSNDK